MHLIPIMLPLEEDELLGSWLYRLSKANLFDKPDVFLKTFVRPNSHKGYQYINFVGDEEFPAVYQAMQLNTSMADLYLKTTCYGGLAPFITRGQQTRHTNLSFQNTYAHSAFVPKANPLIDELRYCEHCRCEEMRNMGFWYYHRAHQLPGVRVCHKHGCLLKIFDGKIGHEFDEEAPSRSVTPNAEPSIMQQYSVFAKDILVSSPDTDITGTKYAIMSTLQERGYTNCGEGFNKLWSEIERRGMAEMFPVDISQYIRLQLASLYTCMHIEYLSKKRRPQINADFINRVAQKYYPQMKELLETIEDPQCEEKIHELLQQAHKNLEAMQDKAQQEIASKEIIASQAEALDTEFLEKNVLRNIMNVSDDYSADSIHSAFIKVVSKNNGMDEKNITKAVFSLLQKGQTDNRPRRKQTNRIPHTTMLNDILTTSA